MRFFKSCRRVKRTRAREMLFRLFWFCVRHHSRTPGPRDPHLEEPPEVPPRRNELGTGTGLQRSDRLPKVTSGLILEKFAKQISSEVHQRSLGQNSLGRR